MKQIEISNLKDLVMAAKSRPKSDKVFHRDFLGAHRYTTKGGTARSAEGVLRTAVVCLRQPSGDATLPLRCMICTYPCVYFMNDKPLRYWCLPSIKSEKMVDDVITKRWCRPWLLRI